MLNSMLFDMFSSSDAVVVCAVYSPADTAGVSCFTHSR
jgi:hypothetical protein